MISNLKASKSMLRLAQKSFSSQIKSADTATRNGLERLLISGRKIVVGRVMAESVLSLSP